MKKLMKYDLKKMTKTLFYFYGLAIIFALLTRLISLGNRIQFLFIISKIFEGITFSAIFNVLINTFIHIILTFYIGFYKDESYLIHTLPVSKDKLMLSKFLSGLIVVVSSVVVCVLSLFILFYSKGFFSLIKLIFQQVVSGLDMPSWLFLSLIIMLIFLEICTIISMAFTAIVKANTYLSKRVLKGLLTFAFYFVVFNALTILVFVLIFALSGQVGELFATTLTQKSFVTLLVSGVILYLIGAITFYFLSLREFKKGVNVD